MDDKQLIADLQTKLRGITQFHSLGAAQRIAELEGQVESYNQLTDELTMKITELEAKLAESQLEKESHDGR